MKYFMTVTFMTIPSNPRNPIKNAKVCPCPLLLHAETTKWNRMIE